MSAATRAFFGLVALSCAACDFNLTIVHTNDVHARYQQANAYGAACSRQDADKNKCFAGVARRYTKIKELRQRYNNSMLLLDAGDQYQGTFWFYVHRGNITAHFMRRLGYDAMTLGNHEFDLGVSELAPFLKNVSAQFPVVSCNIDVSREPELSALKPYAVFNRSGHRIGVVGYTTPDTTFLTAAPSTATLTFLDEVVATRRAVAELRQKERVDVIIALGHSGYDVDQRLAAEIEDVDIVVGGHTHTFLYSGSVLPSNDVSQGPYPTVIRKPSGRIALVVQDFFFGKYLGHLIVTFADNGTVVGWSGAPILLNASIHQDVDVLREVDTYGEVVLERGKVPVGSSTVFLNGSREQCRARECNLGNLVTDAFAAAYDGIVRGTVFSRHLTMPRALAVINGGGIRTSMSPGSITFENILETLPFNTMMDVVVLKGRDVLAMFEQSVARYNLKALHGGFLQVSGFKVVYHMFRDPYSRVASVHVRCQQCSSLVYEPLDANKNYTIVVSAFIVTGGDNYTVVRDNKLKHELLGSLDSDLLINYIRSTSPVHNRPDDGNRLQLVFEPSTGAPSVASTGRLTTWTTTMMLIFTALQSAVQ
uniref:Ecto-5'-nucleotidase n=1 Tax=Fredericella sultana TaxID=349672 RepID=J7Q0Z4_9BILA|nr:ecto-5'-nucleotidase [Fredericella sultana]